MTDQGPGPSPAAPAPMGVPANAAIAPPDLAGPPYPPDAPVATGNGEASTEAPFPASDQATAQRDPLAPTRAGRAWARVLPALVLLALILVFVFQNLHNVRVSFFTASGRFPLALALLASAAAGALLVLAIGSVRILQLRRAVKQKVR